MLKPRFNLLDLLMWVVPAGIVAALLGNQFGSGAGKHPVQRLAVSPDRSAVAALFADGTARVWDAATAHRMATLKVNASGAGDLALSSGGKTLAVARQRMQMKQADVIELWGVATGKLLRTLPGAHNCQLAFSGQGGRLAWAAAGAADLYQSPLVPESRTALDSPAEVPGVSFWYPPVFSPDGRLLALRNQTAQIVLFDAATGRVQAVIANSGVASSVVMAFSEAGGTLIVSDGQTCCQIEATQKVDSGWDFSNATFRTFPFKDIASQTSAADLPNGWSLFAAAGQSMLEVHPRTHETFKRAIIAVHSAVSGAESFFAISDLYRVDLRNTRTGDLQQTLWDGSAGISSMCGIAFVIWFVAQGARTVRRRLP